MTRSADAIRRSERASGAPHAGSGLASPETDNALALVMAEVVTLMGGHGSMLSVHPEDENPVEEIFADEGLRGLDLRADLLNALRHNRRAFEDGHHHWERLPGQAAVDVLLMPIERAASHSRLVMSIVFKDLSARGRQHAERLYRERRPFAIGYFHLWQANRQLTQRAASLEEVLDQTAVGVLLLDRAGRLVFANHTGQDILDAGEGLTLNGMMLRATHRSDGANFEAALGHMLHRTRQREQAADRIPLIAFRRELRPPLVAAILRRHTPVLRDGDIAVVMYVVDPVIDTVDMLTPLCRLFGLSPVEARLACHLAAGETLAEAASKMRVKEQTARTYLKGAFAKTGTHRQTELVTMLLSSLLRMKSDASYEVLASDPGSFASR